MNAFLFVFRCRVIHFANFLDILLELFTIFDNAANESPNVFDRMILCKIVISGESNSTNAACILAPKISEK